MSAIGASKNLRYCTGERHTTSSVSNSRGHPPAYPLCAKKMKNKQLTLWPCMVRIEVTTTRDNDLMTYMIETSLNESSYCILKQDSIVWTCSDGIGPDFRSYSSRVQNESKRKSHQINLTCECRKTFGKTLQER